MNRFDKSLFKILLQLTAVEDRFHLKGDYLEIFEGLCLNQNTTKARRWLFRQLVVTATLSLLDALSWRKNMIKNNIKMTIRAFSRQKSFSFINILGLAVGLASVILILKWVQDELSYDRFHKNGKDVYVATYSTGSTSTPTALAGYLKREFPEVIRSSKLQYYSTYLNRNDIQISQPGGYWAEPDFLQMITLDFTRGNAETALNEPLSIIISERLAQVYFGNKDPIGKTLNYADKVDLKVTGVFENYPTQSHLNIEYIIPVALIALNGQNMNTWDYNSIQTYVQVRPGTDIAALNNKISPIVEKHRPAEQRPLGLQSILRMHLYRYNRPGGPITNVYIFSGMAFLVLLIACVNFINLATSRAAVRAREVGIRKTLGASRSQLTRQFFSESMAVTVAAALLSILLIMLILPLFNTLTAKSFSMAFLFETSTLLGIAAIVLLTGIVAGIYPALILSRFHPMRVLRGKLISGFQGKALRKALVIFQFTLSIGLILCTLVVYRQVHLMQNKDLGYDPENIVYFNVNDKFTNVAESFRSALTRHPGIESMTVVQTAPYRWNSNANGNDVTWDGQTNQKVSMVVNRVDAYYAETLGLKIKEGRFFSPKHGSEAGRTWVINEAAVRAMEVDNPVGKSLTIWDKTGIIIGVVKDFHYESLRRDILPLAMAPLTGGGGQACIRISRKNIHESLALIKAQWDKAYPDYEFNYSFLDDTLDSLYRRELRVGKLFRVFTVLGLFISCLGLFGLAAFMMGQRQKEIAIRKVCGASSFRLHQLLTREMLIPVAIAMALASPIAWWQMNNWLNAFPFRIKIGPAIFLLAGGMALMLTLLTVSYHAIKATRQNPVKAIRNE